MCPASTPVHLTGSGVQQLTEHADHADKETCLEPWQHIRETLGAEDSRDVETLAKRGCMIQFAGQPASCADWAAAISTGDGCEHKAGEVLSGVSPLLGFLGAWFA